MLISLFRRNKERENQKRDHVVYIFLTIFSTIGLIASFVLSYEKLHLLENPNAQLSCSFNAVFNCASVMKTEEATVLADIPNSFFGIVGFTAALSLSVALLAGARLPRWMLIGMQIGFLAGWVFALWLFFNSVYDIQILCPWCLAVTISTTVLFFGMLRVNLRENVFNLKGEWKRRAESMLAADYDKFAVASILFLFILLIILKFRDALFI